MVQIHVWLPDATHVGHTALILDTRSNTPLRTGIIKMKVYYNHHYNINLGLLNFIHPFDGMKFKKVFQAIKNSPDITIAEPLAPVSQEAIENFVNALIQRFLRHKSHIFRALEVPNIPFVSTSFIDKKVLSPMRWGVAGTIAAATEALKSGQLCWNLAGGYHHASPHNMEGFCIYNDIGICYQQLLSQGLLSAQDKILIIDTDAHHGNGNATTFMENDRVTILDIYNSQIYPMIYTTRERVNIGVPLAMGTTGETYLEKYTAALKKLDKDYRLAFAVAGTDVLASDKLGGLKLSVEDVVNREKLTVKALLEKNIPTVILGGGGYSRESAKSIAASILACVKITHRPAKESV